MGPIRSAENNRIGPFAVVHLACWVLRRAAAPNVLFTRIVLQIGHAIINVAVIHVLAFVVSMHCALHKITSPNVLVSRVTRAIRMQAAINDQVSANNFLTFRYSHCIACMSILVVIYDEVRTPCNPSPCGFNAICKERSGAGSCTCMKDFYGDPYVNCRPECVQNSDCPYDKSCMNTKCVNPCIGTCGFNAECQVRHHQPVCSCLPHFTGNPSQGCREIPAITFEEPRNPCQPSPCGPYSVCRVIDSRAVCSCQINFFGSPPNCKPECIVSSECPHNRACSNQRCVDPCPGTCGRFAQCRVTNHAPICSCNGGYTGDPFTNCFKEQSKPIIPVTPYIFSNSKLLFRSSYHCAGRKSMCSIPLWTEFCMPKCTVPSCLLVCPQLPWAPTKLSTGMLYKF